MLNRISDIFRDARGATAVEFAIVGPVFLLFMLGLTYTGMLLFANGSLQYAVQAGARCASIQTAVCSDSATTISYTKTKYYGPILNPTFTYSTPTCGHQLTSTTNFGFNFGLVNMTVPLSAKACYP